MQRHGGGRDYLGETGPAAACVVLRLTVEERTAAGRAAVDALVVGVGVLAGEGPLGPRLSQHGVLLGRETLPPLLLGARERLQPVILATGDRRSRTGDTSPLQPAVAIRNFVEVLLVILLGVVEGAERRDLGRDLLMVAGLAQRHLVGRAHPLGDPPLPVVGVEDRRAVLRPDV